jgi:hypothetical protein
MFFVRMFYFSLVPTISKLVLTSYPMPYTQCHVAHFVNVIEDECFIDFWSCNRTKLRMHSLTSCTLNFKKHVGAPKWV